MVKEKLAEIGLIIYIESVFSEFELNIMKSVDQMMPSVNIMGYYFHFKNEFINKIDKNGMKTLYEQDK